MLKNLTWDLIPHNTQVRPEEAKKYHMKAGSKNVTNTFGPISNCMISCFLLSSSLYQQEF